MRAVAAKTACLSVSQAVEAAAATTTAYKLPSATTAA